MKAGGFKAHMMSSSWLLGSTPGLAEWMIDILADDYAASIHGTHGFGLRHPRAPWLTLVVSDREECACGAPARWEEAGALGYCPRCAEAEIALAAADRLRVAVRRAAEVPRWETGPTVVEAFVPMAALAGGGR